MPGLRGARVLPADYAGSGDRNEPAVVCGAAGAEGGRPRARSRRSAPPGPRRALARGGGRGRGAGRGRGPGGLCRAVAEGAARAEARSCCPAPRAACWRSRPTAILFPMTSRWASARRRSRRSDRQGGERCARRARSASRCCWRGCWGRRLRRHGRRPLPGRREAAARREPTRTRRVDEMSELVLALAGLPKGAGIVQSHLEGRLLNVNGVACGRRAWSPPSTRWRCAPGRPTAARCPTRRRSRRRPAERADGRR